MTLADRFRSKYRINEETQCWEWTASLSPAGYGKIGRGAAEEGTEMAHRVSWLLFRGAIPAGLFVCHKCDNRKCVNPDHLFLGTLQDNKADQLNKGRQPRGEQCSYAKLTATDVQAIRNDPRGATEVARDYGIVQSTVSHIRARRIWRHVA